MYPVCPKESWQDSDMENTATTLPTIQAFARSIGKPVKTVIGWTNRGVAGLRLRVVRDITRRHIDPRDYEAWRRRVAERRAAK